MDQISLFRWRWSCLATALVLATPASGQTILDRADPVIAEEARPAPRREIEKMPTQPTVAGAQIYATPVGSVAVKTIRLEGLEVLSEADFRKTMAVWEGRTLDPTQQMALVRAIVEKARAAGYPLATAMIPSQIPSDGTLQIRVDEGRIAGLRFNGTRHALAEKMLGRLADGMPITTKRLARALRLVEALPGVHIRKSELVQETGLNILVVEIGLNRVAGTGWIDNWGTSSIGPVLARGLLEVRNTFVSGDEIDFGLSIVPVQPREYVNVSVRYALPLSDRGTRFSINASLARSHSDRGFGRPAYDGDGGRIGATLSHPVVLDRTFRVSASLGLSLRDTETQDRGIKVRNDRVALLTGQLTAQKQLRSGYLSGGVALVHGPGWFRSTREGDLMASRSDGSAVFTKIEARASLETRIKGRFSVALDAEAQVASRPLLSGDEFGIGGASFGRAYDYREASGDNAVAASAELRFDLAKLKPPLRRLQLYGYGDVARVWDLRRGRTESLASAGAGLRASITNNFGIGLEVGAPLDQLRRARGSITAWARF